MFCPFQIRKTFYKKMALFSVDHLFFVKQTPENVENIFLKVIFSETNGPLVLICEIFCRCPILFEICFLFFNFHRVWNPPLCSLVLSYSDLEGRHVTTIACP